MANISGSAKSAFIYIIFIAVFFSVWTSVCMAQEIIEPSSDLDSSLVDALKHFNGQFITLFDARTLALKNSTVAHQAEAILKSAKAVVRRERGEFDPSLFAEASHSRTQTPSSSAFLGANYLDEKYTNLSAGARWKLRLGTQLQFSLNSERLETNSAFAVLNPQYSADMRLDITQPLLAGSWAATRAPVTAAELTLRAAEARFKDTILGLIRQVDDLYWDLYATERDLAVLQISLAQSEAFLNETKIRADANLAGPGDVANATVFSSEQKQAELDGQENLDGVSNQLAALIGVRPSEGYTRFRPSDTPPWPSIPIANADSLIRLAISRNYSIKAAEFELKAVEEIANGAAWNVLPAVDLFGSIGGNGLSGTAREVIFGSDTLNTTFGGNPSQSLNQVFKGDYPTWIVGVRASLPIGMRSTRGERDRLRAQVAFAEQAVYATERSIQEQVLNVLQEYANLQKRLAASEAGVRAAQKQVYIGNIEFKAGRISAFEVVRLNADLAAAQLRYSNALVRAAKASAALRMLTSEGFDELNYFSG